jgi:hypothetical protein
VLHDERLHHWTFFLSGSNCDKPFIPGHVRTLHSATFALWGMIPTGLRTPIFWKYSLSVFRWMLFKHMVWNRWFTSMDSKVTKSNNNGLFHMKNNIYRKKTAALWPLPHHVTEETATVTEVVLVNSGVWLNIILTCVGQIMVFTLILRWSGGNSCFVLLNCDINSSN